MPLSAFSAIPPQPCTCLPLGGSTSPERRASHKELSSRSQSQPWRLCAGPGHASKVEGVGRGGGPLLPVQEKGVQTTEGGTQKLQKSCRFPVCGCNSKKSCRRGENGRWWRKPFWQKTRAKTGPSGNCIQITVPSGAKSPSFRSHQ